MLNWTGSNCLIAASHRANHIYNTSNKEGGEGITTAYHRLLRESKEIGYCTGTQLDQHKTTRHTQKEKYYNSSTPNYSPIGSISRGSARNRDWINNARVAVGKTKGKNRTLICLFLAILASLFTIFWSFG